jgi:hypothetical protein
MKYTAKHSNLSQNRAEEAQLLLTPVTTLKRANSQRFSDQENTETPDQQCWDENGDGTTILKDAVSKRHKDLQDKNAYKFKVYWAGPDKSVILQSQTKIYQIGWRKLKESDLFEPTDHVYPQGSVDSM